MDEMRASWPKLQRRSRSEDIYTHNCTQPENTHAEEAPLSFFKAGGGLGIFSVSKGPGKHFVCLLWETRMSPAVDSCKIRWVGFHLKVEPHIPMC